ncbi:hypothetical protein BJF85_16755 [Saccharomonospora sp. CUA-673]|uniref:DUF5047 domain-containing protein n=1 Tax=Saccharomonospora sp. CUA-673 TaxID=1904969 RepID=UPI00096041BF|nr:DUF5047 domain-containing protein [Saccharomonospora sp. CUA-673]OLT46493.1 hypothetical protein BJF85_16755 [Saccharomonospora sp. CUA-673]
MRPVSDAFLDAVRGSHRMCARARVCPPGQTGVDPDGVEIPIVAGQVEQDSTADVRATVDLTTDGSSWTARVGDMLTPYGNELFVERGIVFGNGDREWVSQGFFRIESVEQDDAPRGRVRVAGSDRMAGIIDARPLWPMQFGGGSTVESVFDFLVRDVYPDAEIVFDFDASVTLRSAHVVEDDRYGFLADLADAHGKVMYWDHEGRLRVESPPPADVPVVEVDYGERGVMVSMSRALNRDGVYNAVVARGEEVGELPPVSAAAYDMDPDSPTYWEGPFGHVPRFYASSFVTTVQQARDAAQSMLERSTGLPHEMDLTAVPNPALQVLDPVRVVSPAGDEGVHVLESISLGLLADGGMSATTKLKRRGDSNG